MLICKNRKFHNRENTSIGHRVPLGETDAFSPPTIDFRMTIRFDECGKEYEYEAAELLRAQMEVGLNFRPTPTVRVKCLGELRCYFQKSPELVLRNGSTPPVKTPGVETRPDFRQ